MDLAAIDLRVFLKLRKYGRSVDKKSASPGRGYGGIMMIISGTAIIKASIVIISVIQGL